MKQKFTQRTVEAAKLYLHALEGSRKAQFQVAESIANGDFAEPIAPVLAKQVVKVYHDTDQSSDQFTTRKTVSGIDRDETVQVLVIDSDQSNIPDQNMGDRWIPGTLPTIGPREQYPQIGLFPAYEKKIRASKVGEAFGIDWEAIVNSRGGEVDLIDNAVSSFGTHAANTGEARVAKQLVKSTGFSDAVVAQGKNIPGNPDFSDAVAFADALATYQETPIEIDGNEIAYDSYTLLCAPGQEYRYRRMLEARALRRVPARTGTDSEVPGLEYEFNVNIPVTINVIEWSWLRKVWPGIGKGYILVPRGGDAGTYPVLTKNYLRGYEQPSFWVKDANARQYRGGDVNVRADGDFDSDAIATKVRHVIGANLLWGDGILYSTGSNT